MLPKPAPKPHLFVRWGQRIPFHGVAFATSLAYFAAGVLWIAYSDHVGHVLFRDSATLSDYQSYKGLVFVLATSLLIFVLLASRRPPEEDLLPER